MMLARILVPLDGSSVAECVLDHVKILSQTFHSHVTLLRVLESSSDPIQRATDPIDSLLQRAEATTYLDRLTTQLCRSGLQADYVLLEGGAAQRIVEYAYRQEVDLIILSSHGSTGLSSWSISSVAHKVISLAHTSIMIVRAYTVDQGQDEACYARVLVPLDGSRRAECALPVACALVCKPYGELVLTHIALRPQLFHRASLTTEECGRINRWTHRNLKKATDYLTELQSRLSSVNSRLCVTESDDVIEALHELAEQESVNLIILSAHGISGKRRWPYGSMVNSFIAYGACPLLIVQDMPHQEIRPTEAEIAAESSEKGHHRPLSYAHT